jgi:hypothetical protein
MEYKNENIVKALREVYEKALDQAELDNEFELAEKIWDLYLEYKGETQCRSY